MSIAYFPLELRCGQHVDAVILGVRADKFHESDLPAEVESSHQTIISPSNLKPDALAVQYLGVRSRLLNLVCGWVERDHAKHAAMLHKIQQLSIERVMYAPVIDLHALMAIGPRVTKHTFDDVWMIKVEHRFRASAARSNASESQREHGPRD
jgi:hypothetical protein